MRRFLSILAVLTLLFSLGGCAKAEYPQVEDTFANAQDSGNLYAAEQGDWIAMKSQGEEGKGILLYNKTKQESQLLAQGDYKNIGLLENKVFYCDDQSTLYCFELEKGEETLLAEGVRQYQAREGMVYFNTTADSLLRTIHLQSGAQGVLKISYADDRFWWTDYGLYYYNRENQRLMVLPRDATIDRFVLQSAGEILDLASVKGAQIAYLVQGQEQNTLYTFTPADRQIKEQYQTPAMHFAYTLNRAVLAEGENLCSIDVQTAKAYSWGALAGADAQLLSDCAVSYQDGLPSIRYYPK